MSISYPLIAKKARPGNLGRVYCAKCALTNRTICTQMPRKAALAAIRGTYRIDCGGIALVIPGHEQRNKYCFRHKYNNRERAHFFSLPWRQCRTLAIIVPSAALGVLRCAEEVFDETLSCARSNCLCFPYWRYLLRRSSPQGCEALCR